MLRIIPIVHFSAWLMQIWRNDLGVIMTNKTVAAIIIGIDGWEKYTLPLMRSIRKHEPECAIWVIDNASEEPYWKQAEIPISRTDRLCYSAAINVGKDHVDVLGPFDWYIVLSNDVLCTGPFAEKLARYGDDDLVGPLLKETHGFPYIEGWCIATPRKVWDAIGQWDAENFPGSSWEDVWWSTEARLHGCALVEDLPFIHLDQRQRYHVIPDFGGMDTHNRGYFLGKYGQWAGR